MSDAEVDAMARSSAVTQPRAAAIRAKRVGVAAALPALGFAAASSVLSAAPEPT